MIVKLCAPGILPDPGTLAVSVQEPPRKGDTLVIYTRPGECEQLVVKSVVWTFDASQDRPTHYPTADIVEVVCERVDDVGDSRCGECGEPVDYRANGVDGLARWYHTSSDRAYCYRDPEDTETAYPERI